MSDSEANSRYTPPLVQIEVVNSQNHLAINADSIANRFRRALVYLEITHAEISIAIVDDATIHPINAQHLGHNWPTDVVTFDLGSQPSEFLTGEIIVSAETACTQANLRHVDPLDELMLYLVHGLLHLCGYDDHAETAIAAMRRREGEVLESLGLMNPFPQAEAVREGSTQSGQETLSWPR